MLLRSLVCFAFTALALGCTANDPAPGPGEGTEIDQPGSMSKGCLAGATKNDEGGYCVKLPEGSSTTATAKGPGAYEYQTPGGNILITVRPGDKAAFEAAKAQLTTKATSFGGWAKGTDTAFSSIWRENPTTQPRSTTTLRFENDKIYECSVTSPTAPVLNSCQSLRTLTL